jgi:hypothetical protein
MPVSNSDADRDRLNVAMHWYWFQVFAIRPRCSSGQLTWKPPSSRCHDEPSASKASSTAPGADHRSRISRPLAGVHLAGGGELGVAVLDEGEDEGELGHLARRQVEGHLVGADGVPAVGDRSRGGTGEGDARLVQPLVDAHEGVTRGVEAGDRHGAGEHRRVVAALAQLGHVVDGAALHHHLADRERRWWLVMSTSAS